jgi:hypothetical protein
MNIYQPYTYLIGWSAIDRWYYGVRYAKNCHPEDFWKVYFTSSDIVKELRESLGDPDIIQVRKVFVNSIAARRWEKKVLQRLKVVSSTRWLNRCVPGVRDNDYIALQKISDHFSGSKWINDGEQSHQLHRDKELPKGWTFGRLGMDDNWKKNLSEANMGNVASDQTKQKLSDMRQQEGNSFWGKTHSDNTRAQMSDWYKNNAHPSSNGTYVTPWGEFHGSSSAAAAAPFKINSATVWGYCVKSQNKVIGNNSIIGKNMPDLIGCTFNQAGFYLNGI